MCKTFKVQWNFDYVAIKIYCFLINVVDCLTVVFLRIQKKRITVQKWCKKNEIFLKYLVDPSYQISEREDFRMMRVCV